MNNEIKEILKHLTDYLQMLIDSGIHKIFYNDNMCDEKTIDCINAINDTLDYITNLQQELEIMVKDDERSQETIIRLTKENESLKEYLFKSDNNTNMIMELYEHYKSRCEKAIEYINKLYNLYYEQGINFEIMYKSQVDNLLNILQNGSDDNG